MKILLVGNNYHPFIGGVEMQMRLAAHELVRRGHRVEVVAGNFVASDAKSRVRVLHYNLLAPSFADYDDGGVPVHALTPAPLQRLAMLPIALRALPRVQRYFFPQLLAFGYPWYRLAYTRRLRQIMRGVDVVHSHSFTYISWLAQDLAEEMNVPFVCTPYVHPGQWGDDPRTLSTYPRCDAVIGLLHSDCDYLRSIGVPADKVHEIGVIPDLPGGHDAAAFRRKLGLEGVPLVLYVGRMMPQKGARAVLEAAPLVWQKHPEARFVFIGPAQGDSDDWFKGRDPRIIHLGPVSNQDRVNAMAACDVFVMPSTSEILPTVYLEAWSLAKPVVAGTAHGLKELVADNGAGSIASQAPGDVASALNGYLDDPALAERTGRAGAELVRRKYSLTAVVDQLEALYTTVATSRTRGRSR